MYSSKDFLTDGHRQMLHNRKLWFILVDWTSIEFVYLSSENVIEWKFNFSPAMNYFYKLYFDSKRFNASERRKNFFNM